MSRNARRPTSASSRAPLAVAAVAVVVAAVAIGLVLTRGNGASSGALTAVNHPGSTAKPTSSAATTSTTTHAHAVAQLLSAVKVAPAGGSRSAKPSTVVRVTDSGPAGSRLAAVTVQASTGHLVPGVLSLTGSTWRSTGQLVPATIYTVTYEVLGTGGLSASAKTTFQTAPPAKAVTVSVWPAPRLVVGVGEPIVFTFSRPVLTAAGQTSIVDHLHIAMSKPVPGGWHWFSPQELHFRPSSFWPVGEQVEVTGNLSGWDAGDGEWGEGPASTEFVVGDRHVTTVNLASHEMTVTDNGQVVYTWPISAGAPQWPTTAGTHIVLDREAQVRMISSSVGIPVNSPAGYNEIVYWDVHIADAGEYVHAAPWDLSIQGIRNVSHGCVNISPVRAETFLHFSRVGDIVQVVGPGRKPSVGDHGLMDWSFPASVVRWVPAHVYQLATPVATTPPTTLPPPPPGAPYYPTTLPPAPTTSAPPTTTTRPATTAVPTTSAPPVTGSTTTAAPKTTGATTTVPTSTVPTSTVPTSTVPTSTGPTTTATTHSTGRTSSTSSTTSVRATG